MPEVFWALIQKFPDYGTLNRPTVAGFGKAEISAEALIITGIILEYLATDYNMVISNSY